MTGSSIISFHITPDKLVELAVRTYRERYGKDPDYCVFAPGRVNLIGEQIGYFCSMSII
jgi:galactokinase